MADSQTVTKAKDSIVEKILLAYQAYSAAKEPADLTAIELAQRQFGGDVLWSCLAYEVQQGHERSLQMMVRLMGVFSPELPKDRSLLVARVRATCEDVEDLERARFCLGRDLLNAGFAVSPRLRRVLFNDSSLIGCLTAGTLQRCIDADRALRLVHIAKELSWLQPLLDLLPTHLSPLREDSCEVADGQISDWPKVPARESKPMRVRALMLGWEFPPLISGGLGTACYGLTKAMDRLGMPITFVLPRATPIRFGHGSASADATEYQSFRHVRVRGIQSVLTPYAARSSQAAGRHAASRAESSELEENEQWAGHYGPDLLAEIERYAERVLKLAETEEYDLVHAHDWMTFSAGIALTARTGKPLVVHVHSTEFDRSGEHVNQYVYDIERHGMHAAAKIIAVSNYTRNIIISRYGVSPEKVKVVYNGVESSGQPHAQHVQARPLGSDKIVLFLGRITMQKGPEYFLYAAKRVLEKMGNVRFIMAGDGDMLYRTIELAAQLGIGQQVFFTRFLRGAEVDKAYRMADLYVMPSVSEPFGIAPLEALQHNVPVLVSKQSGIAEALRNALKVDFWDVNEMANKMIAVLRYPPLQKMLRREGHNEALRFRWEDSAAQVKDIYRQVLQVA